MEISFHWIIAKRKGEERKKDHSSMEGKQGEDDSSAITFDGKEGERREKVEGSLGKGRVIWSILRG